MEDPIASCVRDLWYGKRVPKMFAKRFGEEVAAFKDMEVTAAEIRFAAERYRTLKATRDLACTARGALSLWGQCKPNDSERLKLRFGEWKQGRGAAFASKAWAYLVFLQTEKMPDELVALVKQHWRQHDRRREVSDEQTRADIAGAIERLSHDRP